MSYFEDFEEYKIGQEEYETEIEFEESYKFRTTREEDLQRIISNSLGK